MDNTIQTLLDANPGDQPARRRKLLPWWIKTFCWIFMIMGGMAVLMIPYGFLGRPIHLALYGIETYYIFSHTGFVLLGIFILKGLAGFALWTEKDAGVILGIVDACLGLFICFFLLFGYSFTDPIPGVKSGFGFRFEIIALIPYLYKLVNMRSDWDKRKKTIV